MTRDSILPPGARTPLWREVTAGAEAGELRLQHCEDCGQVQYPPREICGNCLSGRLQWRATRPRGEVLSATALEASLEPFFRADLPVRLALIRLEAGPVVYAFREVDLAEGQDVTVEARIDAAGEAVLWALANR